MADDREGAGGAAQGAVAGAAGLDDPRAEMGDAPPFLSWRAIYLVVLGALVVEVGLGAVLTVLYP
jgi:hypothetical protein